MTSQPTITVQGHFGKDKQITREQFIQEWVNHAKQLHNLSWEAHEEIVVIVKQVESIAVIEFTRLLAEQSNQIVV